MNSINIELERTKKKFFIRRLQNELDDTDKSSERYKYLKSIHTSLTATKENELNMLLEQAKNAEYSRKWNRLPQYHKCQKIREYVARVYDSKPEKYEIEKKLLQYVYDDTLNSCKQVDYDTEKQSIRKIKLSKTETY